MLAKKKEFPAQKAKIHPRSKHRERYDFLELTKACPELKAYIQLTPYGDESIDFFNPEAVKMLNKALLKYHYGIEHWDIPPHYLCPPIPGRADYIHHIADLLGASNQGKIPTGKNITCLDIGVGANCIYPIIGTKEYGWSFIGADIDPIAIKTAQTIITANPALGDTVNLSLQNNPQRIFHGIIQKNEQIDLTICNPPFHSSLAEAQAGTVRKLSNLKGKNIQKPVLNFGGQSNELWCDGGEIRFVQTMIEESKVFAHACYWFSTLISKQANLEAVYASLKKQGAISVKTIEMGQGNKASRIVAWTFLNETAQLEWKRSRWHT